jgi:hypothetical protein
VRQGAGHHKSLVAKDSLVKACFTPNNGPSRRSLACPKSAMNGNHLTDTTKRKSRPKAALNPTPMIADQVALDAGFDF